MKNQKGISTLIGLIIIIAIAVLSFGGVFAYQYFKKSQIPITNDQQNSNVQNQNETAGWKTYTNSEYGFEFKYPKDVNLKETPPPSGMGLTGNTVSYQINFDIKPNPAGLKVFQFDYKAVERFYFPRLSIFINTWLSEFPVRSFLALNLYQNFSVYEQSLSYIKEQGILGFGREAVIEQWGEKERILQGSDGWRRAMEIYDKLRENSLWRHEELERRYLVYRGCQNISGLTDTPCWLKATLRW